MVLQAQKVQSEMNRLIPMPYELEGRIEIIINSQKGLFKEQAEHYLSRGGKKLRPLLVMISASFKPSDREAVLDVAAAAELIHTASLIHDDIVDRADLRRGQVTLNKRFGDHVAVLTGDFLFARALEVLSRYSTFGVLEIMAEAIRVMSEGEIEQVNSAYDFQMSKEKYMEMVTKKTGCLFGACCEAGGRLSGMQENEISALRNYGVHLGCAFQVEDDINDIISDLSDTGKSVGLDICQGLITLPAIYALNHKIHGPVLKQMLTAEEYTPEVLHRFRHLLNESGGIRFAYAEVRRLIREAKQSLDILPHHRAKELLLDISD